MSETVAVQAKPCGGGVEAREQWQAVTSSSRLFVTSRDGDVTLVSTGDGVFRREYHHDLGRSGNGYRYTVF